MISKHVSRPDDERARSATREVARDEARRAAERGAREGGERRFERRSATPEGAAKPLDRSVDDA